MKMFLPFVFLFFFLNKTCASVEEFEISALRAVYEIIFAFINSEILYECAL